jgi:cysteine desulfurase
LSTLEPSGGQEQGYRRGTQDAPSALAFAAALAARPYDMDRLGSLRTRLEVAVKESGGVIIGEESPRIATIGAIALPKAFSASLLVQLDLAGIAVSAGSACSSGAIKGSAILVAMDIAPEIAGGFVRVSFGPKTSDSDVDRFLAEWGKIAGRAAARAA